MKKIPHKGEVYPKVEMEGFGTRKNSFSQLRFAPPGSNSRAVRRKRWPRPILKIKKTGFPNGASILVKARFVLFTKTEA